MVVVVALSSCTSSKNQNAQFSLTQETVANTSQAEEIVSAKAQEIVPEEIQKDADEEIVQPIEESIETEEESAVLEEDTEEITEEITEENPEVVASEPIVTPIIRNYSIDGQDLSLSAYPGRAYIAYPNSWSLEKINKIAAYLTQKYPQETKDITYKEEGGIIFLSYPESWGEDELNYAELLLVQEMANIYEEIAENTVQNTPEAINNIEEPVNEAIVENINTLPGEQLESSSEESEYNWWEDPIFIGTYEAKETTEEEIAETATIEEHVEETASEKESEPFIVAEPLTNQETDHSKMISQLFTQMKPFVLLLAVLLLYIVILILKRKKK